ncbi:hypothetical protein C0992_003905 [Termitomyces sp. T32_za158]|nr:hypothetical protein C0992_003905 [Termitomyces sp. T32_za158]
MSTIERSSSPLSERSYAEAVTGSPPRRHPPQMPLQEHENLDKMQVDSPQASSPEIPLSSMPMVTTQEQINIENSIDAHRHMQIEVDDTLGRASEDVNALLQKGNAFEGWQTVTPKKNRKKARKAKVARENNKRPHSDSPIKERLPKRQATINGSETSGEEGDPRRPPSPNPSLALSALDYTDEEENKMGDKEKASTTPRAETKRSTNAQPRMRIFPDHTNPPPPNDNKYPSANQHTPVSSRRGESPMKISTPARDPHEQSEGNRPDDPDENDPELWFETTEADITTNGKGFRRTATPPGGWPRVYLAADPAYNIATETLSEWEDINDAAIWARLYRAKYEPLEAGKTKAGDMIKNVIKNLVFVERDESVAVIFPDQDLPPKSDNRYPHPYHLLVVGLDPQQAQRLLDLEVVASPEATVFFLPRNPPRPLYILTMKGLTYNNTDGARDLVEDLAKKTFRTSPEIRAMIENLSNLPTEDALDRILDIRASFLPVKQRTGTMRCWNLYFANDPGYDDENYKQLRKKMRANHYVPDANQQTMTHSTAPSCDFQAGLAFGPMAPGTQQEPQTLQTRESMRGTITALEHEEEEEVSLEADTATEAEELATHKEEEAAHKRTI